MALQALLRGSTLHPDEPSTAQVATPHRPPLLRWPTASLRTYLVAVALLATGPMAILMAYHLFDQIGAQDTRLREGMQRNAGMLAQSVNRELTSSIDALTILSYAGEIQRRDLAQFEQALLERPLLRQSWASVYLRAPDGRILFDTDRNAPPGPTRMDVPAPGQALPRVSDLQSGRVAGSLTTVVEVPVNIEGQAHYVLGARIPPATWQQLVSDSGFAAPDVLAIADREYRLIARNRNADRFIGQTIPSANQEVIRTSAAGTARLESLERTATFTAWDTVPLAGWRVYVGMRAQPIDSAHRRAIVAALGTALACTLLGVLLALLVARQMTRPLRQLALNDPPAAPQRIAVREISLLRDALAAAKAQDEAARELIRRKRDLLRKKADEFETVLASCPIGLAFAEDRACRLVKHNAAMQELFGRSEGGEARHVTVVHQGRILPRPQQPLQRAAAHGQSIFGMELELRVEGRPPAFVIVNAVPLLDEYGEPRGAIGAVVDITGRKAAEARLISAEQRLRESQRLIDLAQETGHVGFFHYQVEDRKLAWTPGQAKLFGLAERDRLDRMEQWTTAIAGGDRRRILRTLLQTFRARQEMGTVEYCVHLGDGTARWLSSRVRLLYGNAGEVRHIIGVTVDMTEQKNAERERDQLMVCEQAARIEAEKANRAKDEFLAMLGHELRNPLSAIASGVEVLNRVDGDTEVARNARRIIDRQTRHLAHMMDDLLDVARVLSGQSLALHALELGALAQRVIAALQIAGELREHTLETEVSEVWIEANATRIEQVVGNLLTNAIKYTPPGGRIVVRAGRQEDGRAFLEVEDNGVGIAEELVPRVFDLFVQGERSLDRRGGGLGIGLTLVRRLVELHGGSIAVARAEPGTIMRVTLPAIAPPVPASPSKTVPLPRSRRVVLVEDNRDVLEGLSATLRLEGHSVWSAADGSAGLRLILEREPELAIVDVGLPGLTGYELAKRARAAGFQGRMIALSGYGQDRDRQHALAAGFDLHFLKPVQTEALLEAINEG